MQRHFDEQIQEVTHKLVLMGRLAGPDNSLKQLIASFIGQAVSLSQPGKPVRVAVFKRNRLFDLEELLEIYPAYWIQLRINMPSLSLLERRVQENLAVSGFRYEAEWATQDGGTRLVTYNYDGQPVPAFLFWVQNRKESQGYSLLLPVHEPNSLV